MTTPPVPDALATAAELMRARARDVGREHATIRHRLVAALLRRSGWPAAATVVADLGHALVRSGDVHIRQVLDRQGADLWDAQPGDTITTADTHLTLALDFASPLDVGWTARHPREEPGTPAGNLYTLALPATPSDDVADQLRARRE